MFGKGLTDSDMAELTARFADPSTEAEHRDRALFLVMSSTGLRAAEVLRLKWSDAVKTPEGKEGFWYVRKGGRTLLTIPSPQALEAVRAYHAAAGIEADRFFHSLPNRAKANERTPLTTRSLQRIVNAWNVTTASRRKVHPHALRHTVLQRVHDREGSIAAQMKGGHSSMVTTSRHYVRPYHDGTQHLDWSAPEASEKIGETDA